MFIGKWFKRNEFVKKNRDTKPANGTQCETKYLDRVHEEEKNCYGAIKGIPGSDLEGTNGCIFGISSKFDGN